MTFIEEFNALSQEAQDVLLITLIGNRPILANLEIAGNVERIGPIDDWLVMNIFVNKQDGPAVIQAKITDKPKVNEEKYDPEQ